MNNIVNIIGEGSFYSVYDDDAYIISNIMGYKLINIGHDRVKTGFPVHNLKRVLSFLNKNQISYTIKNEGISKDFGTNNKYNYAVKRDLPVESIYHKQLPKTYTGSFCIQFLDEIEKEVYNIGENIKSDAEIVKKVYENDIGKTVTLNSGIQFKIISKNIK